MEILGALLDMAGAFWRVCGNSRPVAGALAVLCPGERGLILMEVRMPVMNGCDAVRVIRDSGYPMARTIPIIAMTAGAFAEDIRDALETGMNARVAGQAH